MAWFAAAHLIPRTSHARWDQVSGHDVQRWLVHLLTRYSDAYASNQFRALQQFFRWLAEEEQLPDPMARLRAPTVSEKLVPVFTSEELSALEKTCQGRSFAQRRDAAIIAVLTATGIRAGELAGIRYDPRDPRRSDVDLWRREITVRGKGGRPRVVRIGHEAARAVDRYIRVRSRHGQAHRPQLWLGVNNRGPMTANGIYQMIARRGRQCRGRRLDAPVPASFQPYLAGPRRGGGGPDGAERLVLPADAAPLRRQRPQRPRPPQLRPHHAGPAVTRAMTR